MKLNEVLTRKRESEEARRQRQIDAYEGKYPEVSVPVHVLTDEENEFNQAVMHLKYEIAEAESQAKKQRIEGIKNVIKNQLEETGLTLEAWLQDRTPKAKDAEPPLEIEQPPLPPKPGHVNGE